VKQVTRCYKTRTSPPQTRLPSTYKSRSHRVQHGAKQGLRVGRAHGGVEPLVLIGVAAGTVRAGKFRRRRSQHVARVVYHQGNVPVVREREVQAPHSVDDSSSKDRGNRRAIISSCLRERYMRRSRTTRYVLSRERVDVGEVDRSRRGEADVRHHVGGPDRRRRVGQEPCQGRRRRRLDVVELPEAVAAPVVVRQAPPVGVHVGLAGRPARRSSATRTAYSARGPRPGCSYRGAGRRGRCRRTRFLCARTTVSCLERNIGFERTHTSRLSILRTQETKLRRAEGIRSIFRRPPFSMGCS
jgi:hypothetical protein